MPAVNWSRRSNSSGGVAYLKGAGSPASGTGGVGAGYAGRGAIYSDDTNGTLWINRGTSNSPYWYPVGGVHGSGGLWGIDTDFRETQSTALSDTTAALVNAASGLRIFGAGVAEVDGGALNNSAGEGGNTLRMTASATNPGIVAIGSFAGVYQPDQHGMAIVEAEVTNVSAITLRGMGIGFLGLAADNLAPPITAATTVATLVQDDLALMHFNVGYTDTDRWYVAHNKSDAAPSMTVVDTGVDVSAAATYQLLRVEVGPKPDDATKVIMRCFINRALVATVADALDEDEEASPVLYLESTSAAIKIADVRRFWFSANRL